MNSNKYKIKIWYKEINANRHINMVIYGNTLNRAIEIRGYLKEDVFEIEEINSKYGINLSTIENNMLKRFKLPSWFSQGGVLKTKGTELNHYLTLVEERVLLFRYAKQITILETNILFRLIEKHSKLYGKKSKIFGSQGTQGDLQEGTSMD